MRISEEQRETFDEKGLIRLAGLLPPAVVDPVRDAARGVLERAGVWRDGAWLGDPVVDWRVRSQLIRRLKDHAKASPAFKELVTPEVREAVGVLVDGRRVRSLPDRPQILFTPPDATDWTVPHRMWHLDVPRLGEVGLPGVQMFAFLDAVEPGGGGTLVVAGSHRLLNDRGRVRSKDVKKLLKREPYFRELLSSRETDRRHFLQDPGCVGDVELELVELHGQPGDVFLSDLRLLHTLAPNASRVPRLMVTQRFFLDSIFDDVIQVETDGAEPLESGGPAVGDRQ